MTDKKCSTCAYWDHVNAKLFPNGRRYSDCIIALPKSVIDSTRVPMSDIEGTDCQLHEVRL